MISVPFQTVPFQTILVAIDESEVSNKALAAAIGLAKALDAKLMLVHVLTSSDPHSPQLPYTYSTPSTTHMDEAIRQQYEQDWINYMAHYESLLKQKTDQAIAAGVNADFVHPGGFAGPTLCEVARTTDVSLIIIGSHQRRGMAEIMLGSTSNYVTHHAPCSVLVVHPNAEIHQVSVPAQNTAQNSDQKVALLSS
ncbi:MAG: universal stress protein [Phormidesmis sp. RL_2_1]|nr:universal stress protein [Phormidesmis sp. RL_2_1]